MRKLIYLKIYIFIITILLSSCAIFGDPTEIDETTGLTDYEVLQKAKQAEFVKDWPRAISVYEKAERKFPNSKYAPQFKLNLAYAYKEFYREDEAIMMIDKFIRSYPNHPAMDYALYLKGVVFFRDKSIVDELTRQDISDRDLSMLEKSFQALKIMTDLYPNSEYFDDAKNRMTYLMNKISERELYVARFYMKKNAYLAALNRAKYILENYPFSVHKEEALVISISAYKSLGLDDLAESNKRVLELNFPKTKFSEQKIQNNEKTWWKFWDIL
jgi:outer membrane protein assembly factor BamD